MMSKDKYGPSWLCSKEVLRIWNLNKTKIMLINRTWCSIILKMKGVPDFWPSTSQSLIMKFFKLWPGARVSPRAGQSLPALLLELLARGAQEAIDCASWKGFQFPNNWIPTSQKLVSSPWTLFPILLVMQFRGPQSWVHWGSWLENTYISFCNCIIRVTIYLIANRLPRHPERKNWEELTGASEEKMGLEPSLWASQMCPFVAFRVIAFSHWAMLGPSQRLSYSGCS